MLWGAYVLESDAVGAWLFTPAGSRYRAEQAGQVIYDDTPDQSTLHLSPHRDWWFARCDDRGVLYVDAARPTDVVRDEWRYDDLYLDLHKVGQASVTLDDEDEFLEAAALELMTAGEQLRARTAMEVCEAAINGSVSPFDEAPWERLSEAMALSLSPLSDLPPLL
jgi:uncharacterized protein DUF402